MKLRFISNGKIEQDYVLIGKSGQIRFKVAQAEAFNFKKDERWMLGTDEDEKIIKSIYIIKPDKETGSNGFKMQFQNKSWFIAAKTLAKELNLKLPIRCKVEKFKHGKMEGIKLTMIL